MDNFKRDVAPSHSVQLSGQIYCVALSSFEWSQNLVCAAMSDKIAVGCIKFQEVHDDLESPMSWELLREFHHESRCHALCWSPDSSLQLLPKVIMFCAAGADFKLRIITSDLVENDRRQVLEGHTDYINAISWEQDGESIASVGDDHTVRLWNIKAGQASSCIATFYLTSPGMDVSWHPDENGKLLAGEKNGLIHLYNARSKQAILSLDAGSVPLMSAHWAPSNRACVGAIAGGELLVWDLEHSSRPVEKISLHEDGGRYIRFSPNSDQLIASMGRPNSTLKVTHTNSRNKIPQISSQVLLFGGLSWHYSLPYVCVGNDRKLCFWKVTTK